LNTQGGDADSAFRIGRCLQRQYEKGQVILFVSQFCKSSGTLIALGCDEVVMTDEAELGPLDVQFSKPDELFETMSGLTPIQALTTLRSEVFELFEDYFLNLRQRSMLQITTKTATDVAAQLAVGLFKPIYEQIDPMRLGELQRAMMIANEYGERLKRKNLKEGALGRLISGYPSHSFIIDREEAETLFCNVRAPTEAESRLAKLLEPVVYDDSPTVEYLEEFLEEDRNGEEESDAEVPELGEKSKPKNQGEQVDGSAAGNGKEEPSGPTLRTEEKMPSDQAG
jgi:hypothetical protein